jgi:diguanylate cyclase (GGDEF)-like protein
MSSVSLFSSRSHGALLSRLVWPTTILFALTLCVVFTMILWTSDSANRGAADRQRVQLTAAMEQKLGDYRTQLSQLAESPGFFDVLKLGGSQELMFWRFGMRASQYLDFSGAFLLDGEGRVVSGMVDGAAADGAAYDTMRPVLGDLVDTVRTSFASSLRDPRADAAATGPDFGIARLLHDGRTTFAVVVTPILLQRDVDGAPRFYVTAGYKRFTEAELKRIADLHAIDDFRLVPREPSGDRLGLPVYSGRGEVKAWMSWRADRPGDLMRERLVPLTLFGSCLALALFGFVVMYIRWVAKDLAQSQEEARTLLGRDPLSGLPNRLLFGERLEQELSRIARTNQGLAVMFLDLDRFKDVNDTYGHQAGDELIKLVARRLGELLRGSDTLARFGGDEFAIIQTEMRSSQDAEALARRILDALTHPFEIAGTQVTVGVSIGVSLAPENGTDRETLMRLADTALYQAKSEGRNRHSFFERKMDETIRMRKVVEDDLRQAISQDGLVLHYQPLVSADGQTIVGLEALVRWPHAKQGLAGPARFISLAEERGLVIPLGEWVLRRACEDGRRWPGLRIAVNVSPIQFRHRDFVTSVMRALKETGFEPSRLELELTEGVVVEDADAAEAAMMELRALGVHLALDDFGTGYSSLIYLRRFAFDKIKIDRSFLESMEATGESAILVHSIVHLGRALGLTVTAEGVETKEQHRFLQALGCHQLQGYLFSKPVPPDEIDRLLALQEQGVTLDASAA